MALIRSPARLPKTLRPGAFPARPYMGRPVCFQRGATRRGSVRLSPPQSLTGLADIGNYVESRVIAGTSRMRLTLRFPPDRRIDRREGRVALRFHMHLRDVEPRGHGQRLR